MQMLMDLAHGGGEGPGGGGSALASWAPLWVALAIFVAVVAGLIIAGRARGHDTAWGRFLLRGPDALERFTGVPGWAAATALVSAFGLLLAGIGFYSDVAYHIAFGRDEDVFTAPHMQILIGLVLILVAGLVCVTAATLRRAPTRVQLGRLRVPWSSIPLLVIGTGAVIGFPMDEFWHQMYGVDVTMWSPPHLMMIFGAAFTGMATWLVIAESGVSPQDGPWARGFHVLGAWLTLLGLTAPAGEFYFGVPQWQQLFHPVLVMLAAGLTLVAMRSVLGRGWAFGIAVATFLADLVGLLMLGGSPIETRPVGTFIGSALAVEAVGAVWGTRPALRFGVLSGIGIGTLGLGVEWLWNTGAHQPWTAALFPDALLVGLLAAVGAAVLGAAFGAGLRREGIGIPAAALGLAALAVAAGIMLPLPRDVGDVQGDMTLEQVDEEHLIVHVQLDPPDAADGARWFMASSWQGGGKVIAHMQEEGPGEWVSDPDNPLEVTGPYKSLLRLHRGAEMMTIPVRLPEDESIGEPELPAEDRSQAFEDEEQYLQREAAAEEGTGPLFERFTYAMLALIAIGWIGSLTVATRGLSRSPTGGGGSPRSGVAPRGSARREDDRVDGPVAGE